MTEDRRCILCAVYRPSAQPRLCDFPPCCNTCRARVRAELTEIPDLYSLLPTALYPHEATGPRVSGSRERPLPLSVDVVDLTLAVSNGVVADTYNDQTGYQPVATVLDQWVRDWRDTLWPDHHLPVPTVITLTTWLERRLDVALDRHPAIQEFAEEISSLRWTLRRILGMSRHIDRLPAPCPTCDTLALYRESGAAYVECGNCWRLWSEDEYQRLVVVLAAEVAGQTQVA